MKTLRIRFTRGDSCTQPGGFILRDAGEGEYPRYRVHAFNRRYGSREPVSFFYGGYHEELLEAEDDYDARIRRAAIYTAGGSLIDILHVEAELTGEAA